MMRLVVVAAVAFNAALLSSCAVQSGNAAPARILASESAPPGSALAGWRIYNQRCAMCHGKDAAGTAPMPYLRERVASMGPRRFANLVLTRYDWSRAIAEDEGIAPIARLYLRETPLGGTELLEMPAWADEPAVVGRVDYLYAYLSARADGRLGTGNASR